ncbi:hypothetical protein [Kitasatospora sp. NPDC092286]|uniref:hypothetical protein n=1 Tax=Kitasatospora sp. NPDC092286 TaxID=3364087 RepID=UPI00382CA93F
MDEYNAPVPDSGEQALDGDGDRPAGPDHGRRIRPGWRRWAGGLLAAALGSHLIPALTVVVPHFEIVVRLR